MMADLIDRKSVIDVIHKAIFDFFDIVDDDDESPMTYKDEQLLTLNKAIVTKIKALPSAQPDVPDMNVGDMISRQAAIDTVRSYYDECDEREESIEERIERLPSADVQPVRHGHWLRTGRTNVYGGFEVECTVCNDNVMITNIEYEHYCRNCGARMDGEHDG